MRTHNICLYKKVNKKYTGCNKTTEFHECALIGVCAVIRANTVVKDDVQIEGGSTTAECLALWVKFSADHILKYFFLIFPENRI